jgi:uncharacterized protein (TIGR03437 family)
MRQLAIILGFMALAAGALFAQTQLTITNIPPTSGNVGMLYGPQGMGFQFTATGASNVASNYHWFCGNCDSGGALPTGLTLSSNGLVSGTPTTVGTFNFTVSVIDISGMGSAYQASAGPFFITISPCAPTITPASVLPTGEVLQPYLQTITATGCTTYNFTSFNLPPGLDIDPKTGIVSGTPTKAGTYNNIQIFLTETQTGVTAASPVYSLTINLPPTFSTTSPLPNGFVGVPYSQQIAISGGVSPFNFAITGVPPQGLALFGNGLLTGTPKTAGTFSFSVTASDSLGVSTGPTTFQVTITSATPVLTVSPTSLTFSALVRGDAPPLQAISVIPGTGAGTNPTFSVVVDAGQANTTAPSWLTVQPASGTAPAQLVVSVDQGTLQAGSNLGRIRVLDANGLTTDVSVTLNVAGAPAQITVAPALLHFAARTQAPGILQQSIAITSSGGNGTLAYSSSVVGGSSWVSIPSPSSGQTTRNSPVLLSVRVNTQGLDVGSYHDVVRVTSSAGNTDVQIALLVEANGSILGVNVVGFRFPARQGAGPATPQAIKVLDLGDSSSTVNWSADLLSGSDWLSLSPATGTATPSTPGVLNLTPNQASGQLPVGSRYALVRISDSHSLNSPQYVVAVLDIHSSTELPLPDPSPAGLFFTALAGGPATPGQQVSVRTSSATVVAFQASASTTDGAAWLKLSTSSGNSTTQSPGTVVVSVDPSKLNAAIYSGSVSISMSGVVRTVNVIAVVEPSTGTASVIHADAVTPDAVTAAPCTASKLAITETGLVNNFSVPAKWPATLIAQLNDDCGQPVTSGSVIASFSNGDAPLTLRGDGLGNYSTTWQPCALPACITAQMVVTLSAAAGSLPTVTAKLIGGITTNSAAAPTLGRGGTVNAFYRTAAAVAPGTIAEVYGTGLATFTGEPKLLPLPNSYSGTFMLVGGLSAPLYYLSDGQLDVQIPNELATNQQYAVVVSSNNALTLPDTIDVVQGQPGVAAFPDGHAIAQHNADYSLVNSGNPAKPGEYLIIYLTGLGPTTPSVPTGAQAPSSEPLARANVQPTVTVGGQTAFVAFAGLGPGYVGLYQITFRVPEGATSGDQNLVVTQGSVTANTTKLTISQ